MGDSMSLPADSAPATGKTTPSDYFSSATRGKKKASLVQRQRRK
jgi:hypothetical protein